jgi:hypothetical protein
MKYSSEDKDLHLLMEFTPPNLIYIQKQPKYPVVNELVYNIRTLDMTRRKKIIISDTSWNSEKACS